MLGQHAPGHDQVSPVDVAVRQFLDVPVQQAHRPGRWQHRSDGDQAERRGRIAGAENLACRREIPECLAGEARIDQQNIARARSIFCFPSIQLRRARDKSAPEFPRHSDGCPDASIPPDK